MRPFIPTKVYGVLNYLWALTMIASPWLFDLVHVSNAAIFLPIYMGWLQLIMAIFVRNETGFIKQFPMQIHMVITAAMGFIIFVSPFLYTFSYKAHWPELFLGGFLMFMAIFTDKSPFLTKIHKAEPEGAMGSTDSLDGRLDI